MNDTDAGASRGIVSVIVLNYKGADDTIACISALADLDWPEDRLEIICVDNDSQDGSEERIRAACPQARVVQSGANLGFAGGCNHGAELARGEYLAFINNDARPDRGWLREAVRSFEADPEIASVACKVLDWDGRLVDFVDGAITWYGMGYKPLAGKPDDGEHDIPKDVLFGTGSGVLFRAKVFRAVGGFDERFFMFYEDVDLGWRLNVLGHRVRYVPASLVFHKHHASISKFGEYRERYLLERNALLSMYKNYDDESLARCLPAAMALAIRRSIVVSGTDARMLDLQLRPGGDATPTVEVDKGVLASTMAIDYFLEQIPQLLSERARIQGARRRSDAELLPLFGDPIIAAYDDAGFVKNHKELVRAFGIREYFRRERRVVIVTGEPLGARMAGPAIRAVEMAKLLSDEHHVRLLTLGATTTEVPGVDVRATNGRDLRQHVEWGDVLIFQGLLLTMHPWIAEQPIAIVADVYDPYHLEALEQERDRPLHERAEITEATVSSLNQQLARADFLLCASDKQRDFWLGQLAGQGRINPLTYDRDESLRSLIDVAPFGLSDEPPRQRRHALRGAIDGIGAGDKVVLWGGGVYNWFDPLTLIRAIDRVRERVPDVRLVFMGMKHPNPDVPAMFMAQQARDLAAELGLTGVHVFFNETWVPYDERADVLLDADLGVSCHFHHIETEFSFRTRILDYLWAGLPIVCTDGDSFGTLVRDERLGYAVPPEDVEALSEAIVRLLTDDAERAATSDRSREVARDFTWRKTLAPLVRYVRDPRQSSDMTGVGRLTLSRSLDGEPERRKVTVRGDIQLAREYLQKGGVRWVARRAVSRVRRVVGLGSLDT